MITHQLNMHGSVEQELAIEHGLCKLRRIETSSKKNFSTVKSMQNHCYNQFTFVKDTDCLHSLNGHFKCDRAHAPAFAIFVL